MKKKLRSLLFLLGYIIHHNKKSKVIYYHDVGTTYTDMGTPLSLLSSHIEIVKRKGFSIVDKIDQPDNQIMIAFDDGWKGLYDNRSFFIEQKIHPTVFIAVDLLGQEGYMTVEEIKELMAIGFNFQAHTWSHTGLPDHQGQDLQHELLDSKIELERLFGKAFDEICFPQGRFSNKVIEKCKESGYSKLFSSIPGGYYDLIEKDLICRNCVQFMSKNDFLWTLNGTSNIFRNKIVKQHYQM